MASYLFTSESVTEGHPDKLCDQISDAVLDAHLAEDPHARVACETCATTGLVVVMGEITSKAQVDVQTIVRDVVADVGYTRAKFGFDAESCGVLCSLHQQSPDIAMGVDRALESRQGSEADAFSLGAGDQGMMFGFACDETEELMPMPIALAHRLSQQLTLARKTGEIAGLRPDGKTQVTVEYQGGLPCRVDTVVLSTQHDPDISEETLHAEVMEKIIAHAIPEALVDAKTRYLINPTGRFVVGGPAGDCGLTGRKIIVDTYGGYARHGGGAFSGKDPTKVDRSAAYMARYIAKNIVAAGLAKRCELAVAYAIGVAHPVSIQVDTQGTGIVSDERLLEIIRSEFDLRPAAILEQLRLRRPIYRATSNYGHFGRPGLPWEETDRLSALRAYL